MRLSTHKLFSALVLVSLFALTARPILVPDFWWHLRTGQYMVETGGLPRSDPFSYTSAGKEWITHEWGSEILMYWIYQAAGWGGLILVFSIIITAAFVIVYRRCAGKPFVAGLALLLGALSTAPVWGVQPQMITLLLASVFLMLLEKYARDGAIPHLLWMPPLTVAWVNLHGGYLLAPLLIVLVAAGLALDELLGGEGTRDAWGRALSAQPEGTVARAVRRVLPLLVVAVLCTLAIAVNPHGARMYSYPIETLRSPVMAENLRDWLSPNFHRPSMVPFALLLFATGAALALSPKRPKPSEVLMAAVAGLAALRSGRHIPIFALVAIPLLAEHGWLWLKERPWGRWLAAPDRQPARLKALFHMAVLAVMILWAALRFAVIINQQRASEAEVFPRAAVEYIRAEKPPQPLFHRYDWGGYLLWYLHPEYRSYIDGRADVHGDAFMEEYFRTYRGRSRWQESLERWKVQSALVEPEAPIASLLRLDPAWEKVYEDKQAVLFVKKAISNKQ
ncbi:MAG: hypothetical protein ACRD2Y_15735 [Terriglobales bacterium]